MKLNMEDARLHDVVVSGPDTPDGPKTGYTIAVHGSIPLHVYACGSTRQEATKRLVEFMQANELGHLVRENGGDVRLVVTQQTIKYMAAE